MISITIDKRHHRSGPTVIHTAISQSVPVINISKPHEHCRTAREPCLQIGVGEKLTGIHAGVLNQTSVTDDYLYVCVSAGDETTAIWKKLPLHQSLSISIQI